MHPYRTAVETSAPRAIGSRREGASPLLVVASWPVALVLFCSIVRSVVASSIIPVSVLYLAIGYALVVLIACTWDLLRS
jgi:hypothetical protein